MRTSFAMSDDDKQEVFVSGFHWFISVRQSSSDILEHKRINLVTQTRLKLTSLKLLDYNHT